MGSITVKVPEALERDLEAYTEQSGQYMNTSELVRDALRRHLEGHFVSSPACSPDEVVDSLLMGLPAEFDPWNDDGGKLSVTNPFKELRVVISGEKIGPDGEDLGSFRTEMSPGESREYSIRFDHGSTEDVSYKIQALTGQRDPDGRLRSPSVPVPIAGEDLLLLGRDQSISVPRTRRGPA